MMMSTTCRWFSLQIDLPSGDLSIARTQMLSNATANKLFRIKQK